VLNVALTGNVAAGKSSVLGHFAQWGATVIDADAIVREVQQPGSPTLKAIARRFGEVMIRPDGSLDRARLRRAVMGNDAEREALNHIVHPAVQRRRSELTAEAAKRGSTIVVNDIPLLFEVMDPESFDVVVLVDAPADIRRQRLIGERGLSPAEADQLMAAQMNATEKRPRSHYVIDNAGSLDELEAATRRVWEALVARAARTA
jgi:dephospho-CoA kinase